MTRHLQILAAATLLLASTASAVEVAKRPGKPLPEASVHFEQNATDGDVEVVFAVTGGDEGLAKLTVVAPDGRKVIDFTAPDATTLGIRSFRFESPEPTDVKGLKAAYPAGVYAFLGTTLGGVQLHGESRLSHELPATASVLRPVADAEDVTCTDLKITWSAVKDVAAYILEIEQEELDLNLTAKLPGSVNTFAVPNGFLLPDSEYKLAIGTVARNGNTSFVEIEFTTADKP